MQKIPTKLFDELTDMIERQNKLIQELTLKVVEQDNLIDELFMEKEVENVKG